MADQLITGTTLIEDKRSEKGEVYSIHPSQWIPANPDTDTVTISQNSITADGNGITFRCHVNLPNGVKIISVVVHGNAAAVAGELWKLERIIANGTTGENITTDTSFGTTQTTITNAIVNNNNFTYVFSSSTMDTADAILGGVIIYEF